MQGPPVEGLIEHDHVEEHDAVSSEAPTQSKKRPRIILRHLVAIPPPWMTRFDDEPPARTGRINRLLAAEQHVGRPLRKTVHRVQTRPARATSEPAFIVKVPHLRPCTPGEHRVELGVARHVVRITKLEDIQVWARPIRKILWPPLLVGVHLAPSRSKSLRRGDRRGLETGTRLVMLATGVRVTTGDRYSVAPRRAFAFPLLPEQVDQGGDQAHTERGDRRSGIQDEAEVEAVTQP